MNQFYKIFIFSTLLGHSVCGQVKKYTYFPEDTSVVKEEYYVRSSNSNELDGLYTSYFISGIIESRGNFSNNIAVGIWEYFYRNGKKKMQGEVKRGSNYGVWEYFYENGNEKMKGEVTDGVREGFWVINYSSGTKRSEGKFTHGSHTGVWKHFYESGGVQAHEEFFGVISEYKEYYISGVLKMKGKMKEEKKEGLWEFYYEDGGIEAEGLFRTGKKFGRWKHFNLFGSIQAEGNYINDIPDGVWLNYHSNGAVSSEGKLYKGKKDGDWRLYYDDGKLRSEAHYELDDGLYKEYFKSGELKVLGNVVNGKNQDKWEYFYKSGKLEGDCIFRNGEGNYIGYYSKGGVKMKGRIKNDKKIGIWELYEPNGDLAGYYKPYYEEGSEIFWLAENLEKQQKLSEERRRKIGTYTNNKQDSRYFKKNLNEYKALILGYNPVSPVFGRFPLGLEYYFEERLGYEFLFQYHRSPFFISHTAVEENLPFSNGYSFSFRQKFYHKATTIGMPYFSQELRYTYIRHGTTLNGESQHGANESKYEYGLLAGTRYVRNKRDKGLTIDFYVGFALGYREFNRKLFFAEGTIDPFDDIRKENLAYSLRLGLNIGYAFNVTKR